MKSTMIRMQETQVLFCCTEIGPKQGQITYQHSFREQLQGTMEGKRAQVGMPEVGPHQSDIYSADQNVDGLSKGQAINVKSQ